MEDIADMMVSAWNEPFSTDHDPRLLLLSGAKEIRSLRRDLEASRLITQCLHGINDSLVREVDASHAALSRMSFVLFAAMLISLAAAFVR